MLRDADEIPAAPYLKIALRELIARPKLVEFRDRLKALAGLDGDMDVVRIE